MKTGAIGHTSDLSAGRRLRNQFSVFFLFVVISAIVWVFIKLSRDFTSTITYRVAYVNVPSGQILVDASDTAILVGLDAQGFDLANYHFRKNKAVIDIDLSGIRLHRDGDAYEGYILTAGLARKLANQIGSRNELIFIAPDTLKFRFMPEYKKQVPVFAQVTYQLRPQHMLYDSIKVIPDSVWVFGPKNYVDSITSVWSDPLVVNDLQEDYHAVVKLLKPSNVPITYSSDVTEVVFRVEKFTEKAIELPIRIICDEGDLALRIFPDRATVHCLVALKDYRRIDNSMFEIAVVCRPGELQSSSKLRVEVKEHPSWVRIARIEPERVEYILVRPSQ